MKQSIRSWVYRSSRKDEMYLYLPVENDFSEVPEALMSKFGNPTFVMEVELHSGRNLARADVGQVMQNLNDQGYHLQMPPTLAPDLYHGNDL